MDVTEQILSHHQIYGSSDNTNQSYVASGQCFNYSKGNTIQKPVEYGITVFPFKANLKGEVGLFGAENVFYKFNINVKDSATFCLEEPGWVCADIDQNLQPINPADEYTYNPIAGDGSIQAQGQAYVTYESLQELNQAREENGWELTIVERRVQPVNLADEYTLDTQTAPEGQLWIDDRQFINEDIHYTPADEIDPYYLYESAGYEPADLTFPDYIQNFNQFSVYLENKGTNNIYVDSHVDGRLYKVNREEHPYELIYVASKDCVYVGIHARNTKRLPYDMTIYFGYETIGLTPPVPVELKSPCCAATATPVY